MKKNLNFITPKTIFLILSLVVGASGFSQTNPALEMVGPTAANGVVYTYTTALQKNTDNPSGNNFAAYNTPSSFNVTIAITNQTYTGNNAYNNQPGSLFFGDVVAARSTAAAPAYQLMNSLGNVSTSPFTADNNQYSSFGVTAGTGIDIASNYAVRGGISVNALGTNSTTGRYKMGEITITFSRSSNNPLLHFKGLGGMLGTNFSFTAEFTVKSVLNSSNTEMLGTTTISGLSGTNLTVDNSAKTINNSYTALTEAATTNSGRGTVRVQNNDVKVIVLEVYMNGNTSGQSWTANSGALADAFLLGVTAGESDLSITKTVDNNKPVPGTNVTFNLTATNNGLSNNTGVSVTDLLPSGYTYVSSSTATGAYVSGTGVWNIGNLNSGASATLSIVATVKSSGVFNNTASISTTSGISDPVSTNNTVTTVVNIDTDGDGVSDIDDLDDDNDGILDTDEAFTCGVESAASPIGGTTTTYNFESATLGAFSNVTAGNAAAQTIGVYVAGAPGTTNMTAVGKIVSATGPLNTTTKMTAAQTAIISGSESTSSTVNYGVYNFAFRTGEKFGTNTIYRKFVIEYDARIEQSLYNEFGTYISDGTSGNVYTNTSGNGYDSYSTYRGTLYKHVNGVRTTSGSDITGAADYGNWYRFKTEYILVNATTLKINNTTYKYNAGVLSTTPAGTTTFTETIALSGAQSWLSSSFQAGILADHYFDNVTMYWLECDFDGDGIGNRTDLDSDNDGCPDAIEADENVTSSQINANGSINIASTGGVDANGIPNLVNNVGTADIGSDQGQGIGTSQNDAINVCVGIASDDINQTPAGTAVSGNLLTNDTNLTSVTSITIAGTIYPVTTSTPATQTITDVGTITVNSNGTYTFDPVDGYTGTVPPITYTATNVNGGTDTANLYINVVKDYVTGANNPPVANHDVATVKQGNPVTVNPLANDSDPDGNTLTVTSISYNGTAISTDVANPTTIVVGS
ncbi:MAG: DUF11 domain-containing protein, partial [Bacteroidia bacterium]|nr:DUF11 domain-containing protein [Bacteroidia bacterium]